MKLSIVSVTIWILVSNFSSNFSNAQGLFLTVGQKEYYFSVILKTNFFTASNFCKYHGMELASVESKLENDAIIRFIEKSSFNKDSFWISGNDLGEEGKFFWQATGMPFTYTNWSPNEPNNGGDTEDCIIYWNVNNQGYNWNDVPCTLTYYFICQKLKLDNAIVAV